MPRKKFRSPMVINLRKAKVYDRQNPNISSLEESHALLKEVDPDLTSLLELKRKIISNELEGGMK
ncbi:MAG: hypothetical protein Q7U04_12585 [Bacteriovorax sp.]|nr:hypothetical protein [Bacteriovorax sp.]